MSVTVTHHHAMCRFMSLGGDQMTFTDVSNLFINLFTVSLLLHINAWMFSKCSLFNSVLFSL